MVVPFCKALKFCLVRQECWGTQVTNFMALCVEIFFITHYIYKNIQIQLDAKF